MLDSAADLARRLADQAEAVCRHYLSNGRRVGAYWQVGDIRNTRGRSLFVRLRSSARGRAGKWTDAATGEHGDLLDLIRESCGLVEFGDIADEARRFLALPQPEPLPTDRQLDPSRAPAARRLFAMSRPVAGTIAETYLRGRGITILPGSGTLRFHPRCYYKPDEHEPTETWPAMIAAITDLRGRITGVHRTWLDPGGGKAPVDTPRRAMGDLLGHAVRFGMVDDVMVAGEGIETMLSLRSAAANLPMAAALSAAHLGIIAFPAGLRRLYVARDDDPAGDAAMVKLANRAQAAGIEALPLSPLREDFNEDLQRFGVEMLRATIAVQLATQDVERFLTPAT